MLNQPIRTGVILALAMFLLAACASAQNVPPAAVPSTAVETAAAAAPVQTLEPAVPSTGSTANPASTSVPDASAGSSGSVRYELVPEKSEARYRVREQLANVSLPNDAVGKTQQISGVIVLNPDGNVDSAQSKFTVDLSTLQSDRSQRDNFLRRNVLQTNQYPDAVFVPTGVTGLPDELPESGPVTFQVTGDLTVRDVTKPVTWDVTGTIEDGQATGTATTSFTFAEFNLTQPRVPVVLSVEDTIKLEVDLTLQAANP